MNANQFAYVVYISLMIINGTILSSAGLTLRNWQTWIIPLTSVLIYLCGHMRGKLS